MKDKIKNILFTSGCVSALVIICVALGFFGKNEEDMIINRIVGIVAIVSGLGSLLIGISSMFTSSLDNVREYYATGDNDELIKARGILYNYRYIRIKFGKSVLDSDFNEWVEKNISSGVAEIRATTAEEIKNASGSVISFFQRWGLLQRKGFLPVWVFETASGYSVIKLYEAVEDIVENRRDSNPFYGVEFEELCQRIKKKYKKAIAQSRNNEKEYIRSIFGIENFENNCCFGKD